MRILILFSFLIPIISQALPTVKSLRAVLHETATGQLSYDLIKSGALGNGIISYNGLFVTAEIESTGGGIDLSLFELDCKKRKPLF